MRHLPTLQWDFTLGRFVDTPCDCQRCEHRRFLWALATIAVAAGAGVWLLLGACLP